MEDLNGFSEQDLARMQWVCHTLDELDRINKIVDLGGATEASENVYVSLMKRLGVQA